MLSKCANPACPAIFRNLREGRLFVTEVEREFQSCVGDQGRQPQYYWLCSSCCRTMTLTLEQGKAQVIPLPEYAIAARAAS